MPLVVPCRNATYSPSGAVRAVILRFLAQELLAVAAMIIRLGYEFIFEAPAPTPVADLEATLKEIEEALAGLGEDDA